MAKGSLDNAAICFETALQMEPRSDLAYGGLADVMREKGDDAKALVYLQKATDLNPYSPVYHWQMAHIFLNLGKIDQAMQNYWATVHLEPNAQKVSDLAWNMHLLGYDKIAKQTLRQVMISMPGDDKTEIRMAWLMATSPDSTLRNGSEAVRLATEALQSMHPIRSPELLDVLAVAQAAAGQFPAAQATLQEALAKAADHPPAYQAMLHAQLTAFQQGQPWQDRPATSHTAIQKPHGA